MKQSQSAQSVSKKKKKSSTALESSSKIPVKIAALLKWYHLNKRALPWRKKTVSPYEIWMSEVMSQQSTMKSVVPYFERWMKRFPRFEDVVQASEQELLKMWEGLGYYSRVRNIKKAALQLMEMKKEHGVDYWPRSALDWKELPGIGAYTSKAIAAIAFNEPTLPVDGNLIRVFSRLYDVEDPLNQKEDLHRIEASVQEWARECRMGQHADLAQAFMELGSQICRPAAQALCEECPLSLGCLSFAKKNTALRPQKKRRPETTKILQLALLYKNKKGDYLIRQIPENKRLGGQWEFPSLNLRDQSPDLSSLFQEHFEMWGPLSHSITTYKYRVFLLDCGLWRGVVPEGHCFWRDGEKSFPGVLSTISRKLIKTVEKSRS